MLVGTPRPLLSVAPGATSLAPSTRDRDHLECPVPETDTAVETAPAAEVEQEELVEESLVEEVSIDGMCGVY